MRDYLQYKFTDSPDFVRTFDEAPLWSAAFGLLLLKHLELKPGISMIDIGSGAGFPLLELAQRLGPGSRCYGVDPWINANERAREKIKNYGLANVSIIDSSADQLPFDNASTDLIVSNLGINNFEAPGSVFAECARVLKTGGVLALTTNVNGHWQEFYNVFEDTLLQCGKDELLPALKAQQEHRGSFESISALFTGCGMKVTNCHSDQFEMKFVNGSAFLNHYFVKLGWLASWIDLVPEADRDCVFEQLENNLNAYAALKGGLNLTVPMLYMEGIKQ